MHDAIKSSQGIKNSTNKFMATDHIERDFIAGIFTIFQASDLIHLVQTLLFDRALMTHYLRH